MDGSTVSPNVSLQFSSPSRRPSPILQENLCIRAQSSQERHTAARCPDSDPDIGNKYWSKARNSDIVVLLHKLSWTGWKTYGYIYAYYIHQYLKSAFAREVSSVNAHHGNPDIYAQHEIRGLINRSQQFLFLLPELCEPTATTWSVSMSGFIIHGYFIRFALISILCALKAHCNTCKWWVCVATDNISCMPRRIKIREHDSSLDERSEKVVDPGLPLIILSSILFT